MEQDSRRGRCNSLDPSSGFTKEVLNFGDHLDSRKASDLVMDLEPTPAEVAQCEAEVGTLLSIIAELNKKMGNLKAPSEPGEMRPAGPSRPLVPDLLSHRLVRASPDRKASPGQGGVTKPLLADTGGGSGVWSKLQEVLSSVEESISCRRTWAAPIRSCDQEKQEEHLRAAQENWSKATQILDEMERDFGISCPSGKNIEDLQDVGVRGFGLRNPTHNHQEEIQRTQSTTSLVEEENVKLGLHRTWRSGSLSPSYRPNVGAFSLDWSSPPYPGSPLLHRRTNRVVTPLSLGEGSSLGSLHSGSPCPSPGLDSETERLNRYVERLKAKNERLAAALERKQKESEQINDAMSKLESEHSAMRAALGFSEECEEAYGELLSLYDAKRLQSCPPQTHSAVCEKQQEDSPSTQLRMMGTEELSTSFSSAGVTEKMQTLRSSELVDRELFLREQIDRLRRDRAAMLQTKPSSESSGTRCGATARDRKEKTSLFYELISVREEMSDLRSLIRLKEKEQRCLEWSLMGQKAQEAAGVFIPESIREEVEDRRSDQQRLSDNAAGGDGDMGNPLTRPILRELQAVLQREQVLKKRLALVQDSLSTALSDGFQKDNGEQIARLTQAHSKALSSYRHVRRMYREQVWRLEQKVAAMMESQQKQSEATNTAGDALEWRREETVL